MIEQISVIEGPPGTDKTKSFGAFSVQGKVLAYPVLLVDDMIDSRWTMTVCGSLLREAGCGPVFPLAIASTSGGGDTE